MHERVSLHAPCLVQAVLTTGSMEVGGPLVPVDPDHVVAFTPPVWRYEIRDAQVKTDIMSSTLGFENDVVVFPCKPFLVGDIRLGRVHGNLVSPATEGVFPVKFCMEVPESIDLRRIIIGLVVDVEILIVHFFTLIDELDNRMFLEWHLSVAVKSNTRVKFIVRIRRSAEQQGLEGIHDRMTQAEKVAEWHEDARERGIIPRELEQYLAIMVRLG